MNLHFNDAHVATLRDLIELAESRGMKIRFGNTSYSYNDTDLSAIEDFVDDKSIIDLLDEYNFEVFDQVLKDEGDLYFELIEVSKEGQYKYNRLTYAFTDVTVMLKHDWQEELENKIKELQENITDDYNSTLDEDEWFVEYEDVDDDFLKNDERLNQINAIEKLIEFILYYSGDHPSVLFFSKAPTKIDGFGKDEIRYTGEVYREGIALAVFTRYVCEYLGVEEIVRSY